MNSCLRSAHVFLAMACVCQALAFSPFAYGQAAPSAAQPDQEAQPTSQTTANDGSANAPQPMGGNQLQAYVDLIDAIGWEEIQFQSETQQGKDHAVPRRDYSGQMGIRKDEEQVMRAILLDTFNQIREWEGQLSAANDAFHQNPSPELLAKRDALDKDRPKVFYENAVAKLRQALGEETFNKVDAWVDQNEISERTPGKPKPPQPKEDSDSEQAPTEQP